MQIVNTNSLVSEAADVMHQFYTAFAKRDFKAMQELYADNAVFSDPAFGQLDANQVRAMWQMLIERGKDLKVSHSSVEVVDRNTVTCKWRAAYSFGKNRRAVVNEITSTMRIEEGKIREHRDVFSIHKWSSQALGLVGFLFGWTTIIQQSIRSKARKGLDAYMRVVHT